MITRIEFTYQNNFAQSITLTKALYLEKRLTAAHRRYLHTIESLAKVRLRLKRGTQAVLGRATAIMFQSR